MKKASKRRLRTIPCKGHSQTFIPFPEKSNERIHQVASWIVQQGIKVSGYIQEQLDAIVEQQSWECPRMCNVTKQVINTYESQVQ